MKSFQEHQIKKEIAPDLQAYWGDSKNKSTIEQSFAYIKCIAFEKGINVNKLQNGYLICQWNLAKHVASNEELLFFLKKLGVMI
jgi:hypothetical protein